jgi:hypothetical protein
MKPKSLYKHQQGNHTLDQHIEEEKKEEEE